MSTTTIDAPLRQVKQEKPPGEKKVRPAASWRALRALMVHRLNTTIDRALVEVKPENPSLQKRVPRPGRALPLKSPSWTVPKGLLS